MSLTRMKPLPRFIIIGTAVVAAVFAVRFGMSLMPASTPAAPTVVATPVPAEGTALDNANQAVEAARQAAEAAPVAPAPAAPVMTPAAPVDAGLANILGTAKK